MLFVDPDKLNKLTAAALDCLTDVKEPSGYIVLVPNPTQVEEKALAFLTMLCGIGPFVVGGTVFITGMGTKDQQQFPREAVKFDKISGASKQELRDAFMNPQV